MPTPNPSSNAYNVFEPDIKIEGKSWDDSELVDLWSRKMILLKKMVDYSRWMLARGKRYSDMYDGRVFTDSQIAIMEDVEDKIPVQPRIARSPIRALVGHALSGRRSGQVTSESGSFEGETESAEESEIINLTLKHMEQSFEEKYIVRDAVENTMVSCYPCFVLFEKTTADDPLGVNGIKETLLPWDSVVYGPIKWRHPSGKDIKEYMRMEPRTQGELEMNFPDMVEQIRSHFESYNSGDFKKDASALSSLISWENAIDSSDRNELYSIVNEVLGYVDSVGGYIPTFEHVFPVKQRRKVWQHIGDDTGTDYVFPEQFDSEEDWQAWLSENGDDYVGPIERDVVTLFVTVFTGTGLVLMNEEHWFQERGELPGSIFVSAMVNGRPSGPFDDMAEDVLASSVFETESLHSVRKDSGTLMAHIEGKVINADDLPTEMSRQNGNIILKNDVQNVREAIEIFPRTPNQSLFQYADRRKMQMYENTRINESMQGASAPRQSAIAKQLEISQGLVVNAIYIDNLNQCWENHQNKKLKIMPHIYEGYQYLEIRDEENPKEPPTVVELNVPAEFDAEGNVVDPDAVYNDINARKWKWRMSAVDDSPSAKQALMNEAIIFLNSSAGPMTSFDPSGAFFASVLKAMPNIYLKEAGTMMEQQMGKHSEHQNEMERIETLKKAQVEINKSRADVIKAEKQGKSVSVTGDDLAKYPFLVELIRSWGMAGQQQQQAPAASPNPQQQPVQGQVPAMTQGV